MTSNKHKTKHKRVKFKNKKEKTRIFHLKNGFIFDKNEGCWAGQRDPSPSPESQRVLERSDFYFGKRNCFLQLQKKYTKLKITYFVQTRCANTRSLRSLAG